MPSLPLLLDIAASIAYDAFMNLINDLNPMMIRAIRLARPIADDYRTANAADPIEYDDFDPDAAESAALELDRDFDINPAEFDSLALMHDIIIALI